MSRRDRAVRIEPKYKVAVEIKGTIVGVRQVQDRGRIQIPKTVREALNLKDGDSVYWIHGSDGKFYIAKAGELESRLLE